MDINFDCVHCGQHMSIDESGADSTIECFACYSLITVPEKPKAKPPPLLPMAKWNPMNGASGDELAQTRQSPRELIAQCRPLADPVSVLSRLLLWSIIIASAFPFFAWVVTSEQIGNVIFLVVVALFGLLMGLPAPIGMWLLLRQPRKNVVLYLRAFRSDERATHLRGSLKAALGGKFRLCGIRPPQKRVSWFWRIFFTMATAYRYIGSERFELEASNNNWMARLLASMSRARFVLIDVRETTPYLAQEINLAFITLGASRCVFIVDATQPLEKWTSFIRELLKISPSDAANLHILRYCGENEEDLKQFVAQVRQVAAHIPAGQPTIDRRMTGFVQNYVAAKDWKTPFWERDWGQVFLLLLIGWGIQIVVLSLPVSVRSYALLGQRGLLIVTLLVVLVCYFQALSRAWKHAKFEARFRSPRAWNPKTRLRWSLGLIFFAPVGYFLLTAAIYKLEAATEFARSTAVRADVQAIGTQLHLYESLNGFYPTTEQGLQALVTQPTIDPTPIRWYQFFRQVPKDPWGSEYIYRCPGQRHPENYDLYSAGPDRRADTTDDDWGE
jgi:general secretion pathway protein G